MVFSRCEASRAIIIGDRQTRFQEGVSSMTGEYVRPANQLSQRSTASRTDAYDPFVRGRFPVGVRTFQALDTARDRLFSCEVWYPAAAQHAGQDLAPETQDL